MLKEGYSACLEFGGIKRACVTFPLYLKVEGSFLYLFPQGISKLTANISNYQKLQG